MAFNKSYWNEHADLWFGATALPTYGVNLKPVLLSSK